MQGFNRYYPPDYDPKDASHKGNLNRLAGKAVQKAVVRFEMPFNVWCLGCDAHIAQGVRFNAEKKKAGQYLSSPIWSFRMTCHLCTRVIVIATNPKDTCYDVLEGAKKRAEEWNAEENGTFEFSHDATKEHDVDPLYKLERDATRRVTAKSAESHLAQLLRQNKRQWSDPYTQSQKLRRTFRAEKAVLHQAEKEKMAVQDRFGLDINVLRPTTSDQVSAKHVEFDGPALANQVARRKAVLQGPIFHPRSKQAFSSSSSSRDENAINGGIRGSVKLVGKTLERKKQEGSNVAFDEPEAVRKLVDYDESDEG